MPSGDEGTGLHAFDDLDPISTVSALTALPPQTPAAQPSPARYAPPPLPSRNAQAARPESSSVVPTAGARSAPPPLPRFPPVPVQPVLGYEEHAQPADDAGEGDEDTKVVPSVFVQDPEYAQTANHPLGDAAGQVSIEAGLESDVQERSAITGGSRGIDDTELLELSATTVATNIDMDWDEEEVQTKLRDGELDAQPPIPVLHQGGAPSPFLAPDPAYPGNPSPFAPRASAAPSPFQAPSAADADWEDDALTRVIAHPSLPPQSLPQTLPGSWSRPGADSLSPVSQTVPLAPDYPERPNTTVRAAMIGVAAAALLGAGFGARSLLAGDEPANITLVTSPADAEVLIDGRPLVGQTSPFTAQGLVADAEHSLVVRKDGYSEVAQQFRVEEGEFKALPSVELKPLRVETGLELSSVPAGAEIYVDNVKLPQTTPAKLTDLAPGLHVVRLVSGEGYQPWETQVVLASGQMIELPVARLVATNARRSSSSDSSEARASSSSSSSRRSAARPRSRSRTSSAAAAPRTGGWSSVPAAPVAAAAPARSSAGGGGGGATGTLRINSRPWSQVYVDGRMVGNTPQMNLPLAAGSHNVKLVNPQLGMSKTFKVQIQSGKVATKIVDMVE